MGPGSTHRLNSVCFDELSDGESDRIIETLEPFLSEARKSRIHDAIVSRTRRLALVLEDIHNEHNASAVLRTAEAFGVIDVHLLERQGPFRVHSKVSSGSNKWLHVRRHKTPAEAFRFLRAQGFKIWVSAVHGQAIPIHDLDVSAPIALMFGNEHAGLSEEALQSADGAFRVPMHGFVESLNVSVAAAVSMYDVLGRLRMSGQNIGLPDNEKKGLCAAWYALSIRASRPILQRAGLPMPVMTHETIEVLDGPLPPERQA